MSEYFFSKPSYLKYGFPDYPLGWHSDDRAWIEFSENKPIFTINESLIFIRISEKSISGKEDNLNQKNIAEIAFYKFIVFNKLKLYDKKQRINLLNKYENSIKKIRNLELKEWFSILFLYLKNFDSYSLKKVLKRFIKSIIKHE